MKCGAGTQRERRVNTPHRAHHWASCSGWAPGRGVVSGSISPSFTAWRICHVLPWPPSFSLILRSFRVTTSETLSMAAYADSASSSARTTPCFFVKMVTCRGRSHCLHSNAASTGRCARTPRSWATSLQVQFQARVLFKCSHLTLLQLVALPYSRFDSINICTCARSLLVHCSFLGSFLAGPIPGRSVQVLSPHSAAAWAPFPTSPPRTDSLTSTSFTMALWLCTPSTTPWSPHTLSRSP